MKQILVNTFGRLGNQFFQIWPVMYIAKNLGCNYENVIIHHGNGKGKFIPFFGHVQDKIQRYDTENITQFPHISKAQDIEDFISSMKDKESFTIFKHGGQELESADLVYTYEKFIRELYPMPKLENIKRIAVYIRLDDLSYITERYIHRYCQYINTIINEHNDLDVYLVYSPNSPKNVVNFATSNLCKQVYLQSSNDYMTDFDFLRSSSIMVSTASTFSWWAAFFNTDMDIFYVYRDKDVTNNQMTMFDNKYPKNWVLSEINGLNKKYSYN